MFDPFGASPVELLTPISDPFLETPPINSAPQRLQTPSLPKLGPISSAARQHMWRGAQSLTGPAPKSLPSSIPLSDRKTPATEAIGLSSTGKHIEAHPTSDITEIKGDGQRGFVQLLPPPPDDATGQAEAPRESRFFELPPPPEN